MAPGLFGRSSGAGYTALIGWFSCPCQVNAAGEFGTCRQDTALSATPNLSTNSAAGEATRRATILVVEDEMEVRKVVRLTLELQGYHVLAAQDADDALRLATAFKGPIDLLVADVVMPRMNGSKLFDQLRLSRARLRVLFISGYSAEVLADHHVGTDDANFLAKPFSSSTLGRKVSELLPAVC